MKKPVVQTRSLKPKGSNLKRYIIIAMVIVLVLVAVVSGIVVWRSTHKKAVNVYSVSEIAMTDYWGDQTESDGMIESQDIQTVFVSDTQTVSQILVTEGQEVKKGDPLFTYDSTLTDLDLQKADLELQQKQLDLEKAEKELSTVKSYRAGVAIPGSREWISYGSDSYDDGGSAYKFTQELKPVSGAGTQNNPYVYDWSDASDYGGGTFDNATLEQLAQGGTNSFVILRLPSAEEEPAESEAPADDPAEPVVSPEPEETEAPAPAETTEPEATETSLEVTVERAAFSVGHRHAAGASQMLLQIQCDEGSCTFSILSVTVNGVEQQLNDVMPAPEITEPEPSYSGGGASGEYTEGTVYTAAELAEMIAQAEQDVRTLELEIRQLNVNNNKLKQEAENDTVYSELDGKVVLVDEDSDPAQNEPIIKVSADGNYVIQAVIGEFDLDTVAIGQSVTVNVYNSEYVTCEGTVTAIGEYPTSNVSYYYNGGNTNISYYPMTVEVSGEENLEEGDYAEVYYTPGEESTSGIYLENMYLRSEGGKSYVYVESDGRLEKRYVSTGKSVWGSYMEITSGLTMDDYIAFPYGSNVTEGARVHETDTSELWS